MNCGQGRECKTIIIKEKSDFTTVERRKFLLLLPRLHGMLADVIVIFGKLRKKLIVLEQNLKLFLVVPTAAILSSISFVLCVRNTRLERPKLMPDCVEESWKADAENHGESEKKEFDILFDAPSGSSFTKALFPRLLVLCVAWIIVLALITL